MGPVSQILEMQDKSTGKKSNVTISNDKGRLSKGDIERMLQVCTYIHCQQTLQSIHICARLLLQYHIFEHYGVLLRLIDATCRLFNILSLYLVV